MPRLHSAAVAVATRWPLVGRRDELVGFTAALADAGYEAFCLHEPAQGVGTTHRGDEWDDVGEAARRRVMRPATHCSSGLGGSVLDGARRPGPTVWRWGPAVPPLCTRGALATASKASMILSTPPRITAGTGAGSAISDPLGNRSSNAPATRALPALPGARTVR
jgi:hypothetical protein